MSAPAFQAVTRRTAFSNLDFRAKLAVFIAATITAAMWSNPWLNFGLATAVAATCGLVGIPGTYLRLIAKVMTPFFIILLITHGFFNVQHVQRLLGSRDLTPWLTLPADWWIGGGAVLSREGVLFGINAVGKSITFLLLVPLCVFTTDPNHLVVSLVRLRVPYKLAFVVTSTLRFFPLIFDEIQAVMQTQRLRGFAPEELSAPRRVRIYAKVAVPVILSALHKAQQTEVVLQAKGFSGSADRTYLHTAELGAKDWAAITAAALGLIGAIWLTATGLAQFHG
ncbi:energy-coupling factor transporter transmembrane component T family protein [Synoicihabitans lomoniglobus]|uniref:Energy-coupling factor transporter transmembrane component T n=1 Tax=Synoicihabitans lomoniglobus TaxID=2909285 RepID=A0AAF0CR99_9BACT|nr:energy-coupling factor transporter transmembrane protein EcfT [Opitutaceae bacterium LMO-M01]WED66620.1 energy-coupling factor transporter transmembrane component T [Opitutaceae bacterium LMO-M01]